MKPPASIPSFSLPGACAAAASPVGRALLSSLRLDDMAALAAFAGGELLVAGGHRSVRRLETGEGVVFLKQSFRGAAFLERLRAGTPWRSSSGREAANHDRLDQLGLGHPEILAWGEQRVLLREGFSFLLSRAARGLDLEEWLATDPGEERRCAVAAGLVEVVLRLARAGLEFEDLVPRHVFVAVDAGKPVIELIDLHRLRQRPTVAAASRMIERLDAELPSHLLSSGRRLAFLRSIEAALAVDLGGRIAHLRAEGAAKRRRARRRMQVRAPARDDWRAIGPGIFARGEGPTLVARLGLDRPLVTAADRAGIAHECEALGLELVHLPQDDLREIHHGHHYLQGLVALPEALARRIDGGPEAFYLRRRPAGRPLIEVLGEAKDLAALAPRLSLLLARLLEGGFLPRGSLLDAIRVRPDDELLFIPGPTRGGATSGAEVRAELTAAGRAAGLSSTGLERLLAAVDLGLPGLLGSRRFPGGKEGRK